MFGTKALPYVGEIAKQDDKGVTYLSAGLIVVPLLAPEYAEASMNFDESLGAVSTGLKAVLFVTSDISKFAQAFAIGQGYASQTNLFINSAVNSQTPCTFDTMNDMITGGITQVNLSTQSFAADLAGLGQLIDLSNLDNLGSPLALVQRIQTVGGNIPLLSIYFVNVGVPQEVVVNFNNPSISVSDSVQKLLYLAMTQIQGQDLNQILNLLKITTSGIDTMADLLNPVKLFPNSYQSLTVVTSGGLRAIYINSEGTVNSNLRDELPSYVVSNLI
jgi:hypothetical protein